MDDKHNLLVYTDGACSHNGTWKGGWAFVAVDGTTDEKIYVSSDFLENTTNNAMELTAFYWALVYCLMVRQNYSTMAVCSDSAYILNCFEQKWYINWEKNGWKNAKKEPVANKELWEKILLMYREIIKDTDTTLSFIKVKGHSGNKYNELVDRLAVEQSK